jgi:hypothetical protein
MTINLAPTIDNLTWVLYLILVALAAIGYASTMLVVVLKQIRDVLKELVAETAYLSTIDDDDEREGK